MDWLKLLQIIGTLVLVAGAIGAGIGGFFYAFKSKANKLLKEQNQQLKERIQILEDQRAADIVANEKAHEIDRKMHFDNAKAIADLQGQIKIYQNLRFNEMAKALQDIAATEERILKTLTDSATVLVADTKAAADEVSLVKGIAAEDRDVLTNQNLHIKTQVIREMNKEKDK